MRDSILAILLSDTYKQCHKNMYPKNMTRMVSYLTPRKSMLKTQNEMVFYGLTYFVKKYLIEYFNENFFALSKKEVTDEYIQILTTHLSVHQNMSSYLDDILDLHSLGYLPLQIRALPEGTLVPMGVPVLEITNTLPSFAWVVQWVESLLQMELWKMCNHATIGHMYRKVINKHYKKTCPDSAPYLACSDFSMRGMSCLEEAVKGSSAWLLSFNKTSTIPAIHFINKYYGIDCRSHRIGVGAISTEHSVMSTNFAVDKDEISFIRRALTEIYPNDSFSLVADTYDYWNLIKNVLPELKEEILAHNGTLLIRPDSGDMLEIVPETIYHLYNVFGGYLNDKGFSELNPKIKLIYGDGCSLDKVDAVLSLLEERGFAANNIVFGVGSFGFSAIRENGKIIANTRDTFGMAMKTTFATIDGKGYQIFKDPATDKDNLKKSHKGYCWVRYEGSTLVCTDGQERMMEGAFKPVFCNGQIEESWLHINRYDRIRNRLNKSGA